ncbi:hypothetical protein ACOSP7_032104 [Xanthoceras sorbifolium]
MGGLFCEPFPDTSWIFPEDFLFKSEINSFEQNYNYSYGYMLKSNIINYSTELLPSYMFLYLSHDYDHHDKLFFCDQDQALLSKVPWLIMKSNVYFLPSLFLISSFEQELSKLFPNKETVFHHLGSAWSTFGYVAQGLGGMRPWILYKINQTKPDPLCGRGMSMEPCYHAPPVYGCKAKTTVDTATLVPHERVPFSISVNSPPPLANTAKFIFDAQSAPKPSANGAEISTDASMDPMIFP